MEGPIKTHSPFHDSGRKSNTGGLHIFYERLQEVFSKPDYPLPSHEPSSARERNWWVLCNCSSVDECLFGQGLSEKVNFYQET